MPVDLNNPKAGRAWREVEYLNRYFAGVIIEPDEHMGFQRIFGEGDHPTFNYDRGGRYYSVGGGYQDMPRKRDEKNGIQGREDITINGEATVELDISASFLTILHYLLGWKMPDGDPYEVLPDIPRNITKAWVNMTLGYNRFHDRWSNSAKKKYSKEDRTALQREWPLRKVRDRLRPAMPIMEAWLASDIRWGTLQYVESEIVIQTILDLAIMYDVPALPVHDSIIVPASKAWLAEGVLSDNFDRATGIRPAIKLK